MAKQILKIILSFSAVVLSLHCGLNAEKLFVKNLGLVTIPVPNREIEPYTVITEDMFTTTEFTGYIKDFDYAASYSSLDGRIRNASLPVKIGIGILAVGVLGYGAALGIGGRKKHFSGILELESGPSILVKDPSDPEIVKRYRQPKNLYEMASLLIHRQVTGYTRFGKLDGLDLNEQAYKHRRF